MIALIQGHPFWDAVALYWVFSAAVSAMPTPVGKSDGYQWLYGFLHTISGDLSATFASKIPGIKPPQ